MEIWKVTEVPNYIAFYIMMPQLETHSGNDTDTTV